MKRQLLAHRWWYRFCDNKINFNPKSFFSADEFRSKTACENEVIQLVCNPFSRIAIYSASYGRTEYESIQCTQPQGVKEESKC